MAGFLSRYWDEDLCEILPLDFSSYFKVCDQVSTIELSKYSKLEKLRLMQSIWEDLRGDLEDADVPNSHRDLLDARRKRVESGQSKLLEWDDVKNRIGQK